MKKLERMQIADRDDNVRRPRRTIQIIRRENVTLIKNKCNNVSENLFNEDQIQHLTLPVVTCVLLQGILKDFCSISNKE